MKKLLTILTIVTLIAPSLAFAALNDGLVLYAPLNRRDMINATAVYDRSGGNYSMTRNGSPTAVGVTNESLNFNGSSQHIVINNPANLPRSAFTINIWAKLGTISSINWLFSYGTSTATGVNCLMNSSYRCSISPPNNVLTGPFDTKVNVWQMITFSYNGTNQYMYSNGNITPLSPLASTPFTDTPTQGWIADSRSGFPFLGPLDEFRIYNRFLSSSEIKQLYRQGLSGHINR